MGLMIQVTTEKENHKKGKSRKKIGGTNITEALVISRNGRPAGKNGC